MGTQHSATSKGREGWWISSKGKAENWLFFSEFSHTDSQKQPTGETCPSAATLVTSPIPGSWLCFELYYLYPLTIAKGSPFLTGRVRPKTCAPQKKQSHYRENSRASPVQCTPHHTPSDLPQLRKRGSSLFQFFRLQNSTLQSSGIWPPPSSDALADLFSHVKFKLD